MKPKVYALRMLTQTAVRTCIALITLGLPGLSVWAQVEPAKDGPAPMSPQESLRSFDLRDGFAMTLIASEPLIQEPSGVCWDEAARLYVSELHGYNLEGQYDIEALNKTGQLDRMVRRIQADEVAKKKALKGTYGVIKRLRDSNGDGTMDEAMVFADGLPPCFGMVAARGGIIVACAPHIMYLRDSDEDGVADVRQILFTGFEEGVLERRINAPQWGLDHWIYVGGGGRANHITGPHLHGAVDLGRSDFRIRADGSAIEPVEGSTSTFGHTFTAEGDRLTISTGTPGYQVLPISWHYLTRNPDLSIRSLERNAAAYQETYPISKPHPWRSRRYDDPGFSKYYTDRYGKAESFPNGYFTSACSPFIYRDSVYPAIYHGSNFSCEPAQNLIHHSTLQWQGTHLRLQRGGSKTTPEEVLRWALIEQAKPIPELPQASPWQVLGPIKGDDKTTLFETAFGPEKEIAWSDTIQGKGWVEQPAYKDGSVIDLGLPEQSAVYLRRTLHSKQAVALTLSLGSNDSIQCWLNGRVLLENNVNRSAAPAQERVPLSLKAGENTLIMKIVNGTNASGFYFRLQASPLGPEVTAILQKPSDQWTQQDRSLLTQTHQRLAAESSKTEFLASPDIWFHPMNLTHGPDGCIYITDFYREIIEDYSAIPRYLQQQYGLIHGKDHGRIWRLTHQGSALSRHANLSILSHQQLVARLASERVWERETAQRLLIENPAGEVAPDITSHLMADSKAESAINALYTLEGMNALTPQAMQRALEHPEWSVRRHALRVGDRKAPGDPIHEVTARWLEDITHYVHQPRLLIQLALSLGSFQGSQALNGLAYLAHEHGELPWMDIAILSSSYHREDSLLGRLLLLQPTGSSLSERLVEILALRKDALQARKAMAVVESLAKGQARQLYRAMLASSLEQDRPIDRLVMEAPQAPDEATLEEVERKLPRFLKALNTSDEAETSGRDLFKDHCAACHQARGIGTMAGPNLDSEFQRAPETILRDMLFPHETITQGFETVHLEMKEGADVMGLLASESPTSLTLRFPGGSQRTFLRKQIAHIHEYHLSMMPAQFASVLKPNEAAAIISFLRQNEATP